MSKQLDEAAVATAWDRNAEQWTHDVRAGFDLYRTLYTLPAFLQFMPSLANKATLDLGCGEGSNTRIFAQRGGQMTGVDLSPQLIEHARQEEKASPLGIRYEQISFSDLSIFANESFDCAVSTMALMDGPDFPAAMRAAYRVLRPGGLISFSVLHPCFVTPVIQWLQDDDGAYTGLRVGQYFDRESSVERWYFSKRPSKEPVALFEVPRFPRTLSGYLNAVIEAGWRITKIDEPRPDSTLSTQYPWLARWHQHAPLVLFVEAAKP
jgi:ubiquinone/menaquinone biosynthesis C-methylase UbiE